MVIKLGRVIKKERSIESPCPNLKFTSSYLVTYFYRSSFPLLFLIVLKNVRDYQIWMRSTLFFFKY